MTTHTVVMIPGDGIGPEVTGAARRILEAAEAPVTFIERHAGVAALERGADSGDGQPAGKPAAGCPAIGYRLSRPVGLRGLFR